MLRRTQAVCFSPLALFNGWATDDEALDARRRLPTTSATRSCCACGCCPYWYTTFAQYHDEGTPVVRAMPLVAGIPGSRASSATVRSNATTNPYAAPPAVDVKDQYMIGDALLVAPIAPGVRTRKVVLPAGKWFDFYTGTLAGENTTIEVTPPLSQIPLFVRDGSLIPMVPSASLRQAPTRCCRSRCATTARSRGRCGCTTTTARPSTTRRGERSWTTMSVARDAGGAWRGAVTPDANGKRWRYSNVTWTFMTQK